MRLGILSLFLSFALLARGEPTKVIGYLPHYRAGAIDALPYDLLTDVVYFSLAPGANGSIDSSKAKPEILKKLTTLAKPKGVKVHVCVGGWGKSAGFSKMTADPATRIAFVRNLTIFLKTHGLDGADVDWEHPKTKSEIENFQKLLIELKRAFRLHGFQLSVAVGGWGTYLKPETIPFGCQIRFDKKRRKRKKRKKKKRGRTRKDRTWFLKAKWFDATVDFMCKELTALHYCASIRALAAWRVASCAVRKMRVSSPTRVACRK